MDPLWVKISQKYIDRLIGVLGREFIDRFSQKKQGIDINKFECHFGIVQLKILLFKALSVDTVAAI